jgi:hypothetical protein
MRLSAEAYSCSPSMYWYITVYHSFQVDSLQTGGAGATEQGLKRSQDEMGVALQGAAAEVHGVTPSERPRAAVQALPSQHQNAEDELMAETLRVGGDGKAKGGLPEPCTTRAAHIPEEFLCPISLDMMSDPVVLVESGQVFDRDSITEYLARPGNKTCPTTRKSIPGVMLSS